MKRRVSKTTPIVPCSALMLACGLLGLCPLPAQSQTPAPVDYAARVQSVTNLKEHIAQREERFEQLKQDLLGLDARVEKQVESIVKNLSMLKDSEGSRNKIANIKEDVINGLIRTVWIYRQKRTEVFERMRKDTNVPKEELEKTLNTFDTRVGKRLEQVMDLAKSFPGYKDVKKYETSGSSYYNGYHHENSRVSEEWKQTRRDNTSGRVARREVLQELDKAIEKNQSRQKSIADTLATRKLSESESAVQQEELGRIDAILDNLKMQRSSLVMPGGGATKEIGADEAHDAELMLNDTRSDLSRDFSDIMRKYASLEIERTRLYDLKENLAAREEWLKKNPPPAK